MCGRRSGPRSIRLGSGSASSCGLIRRSSRCGCGRWLPNSAMQGGKSIFDDYVREVLPRFLRRRTFQRTVYRPGELVPCDLWEPRELVPVGHGAGASRLCGDCGAVLVAGDRGRPGVLEGGAGHPLGPRPLPRSDRGVAGEAGVGPGGRDRRSRPPDHGVRRVPRVPSEHSEARDWRALAPFPHRPFRPCRPLYPRGSRPQRFRSVAPRKRLSTLTSECFHARPPAC